MKKFYFYILLIGCVLIAPNIHAQICATLRADFQPVESRCAATGAIKIKPAGGSGAYKYRVSGPVTINFTSSDSITGLSAGSYLVEVVDINTGCSFKQANVVVPGNYSDPRFLLHTVGVSCDHGDNGSITVGDIENGRAPFTFTIVAPSPMGVGTSNTTGVFDGLKAGDYSIRLTDSCGGIQTRTVSVQNYTWRIDANQFNKISCDQAAGWIRVIDSRGNISTVTGIAGMQYGVLVPGTDTVWSSDPNFVVDIDPSVKSVTLFAKDACGIIKYVQSNVFLSPSIGANLSFTDRTCATFTANVTDIRNFFSPMFCLYNEDGDEIDCNATGVFPGLAYGSYCVKATDACSDTVINRCFTFEAPIPSIGGTVISNKTCETFDVAVTGQQNLPDALYCLYASPYTYVTCNNDGVFTGLPYGSYYIITTDVCTGTGFVSEFTVGQPMPIVADVITPSYVTCSVFGLNVGGDSLYNPTYCLKDSDGNIIACNNTGIFDDIALGSYCITIHDECRDTTLERCLTVGPPPAVNDMVINTANQTCSSFTAIVHTSLLAGAEFFLYDDTGTLLTSNFTGVFDDLPYGDYCVKAKPVCPDTLVESCFSASPPVPSVAADVLITDKSCTSFTATVHGQSNLTDPVYHLTDSDGNVIATNTTGIFTGVPYGNFCILVEDGCLPVTLSVCDNLPPPVFEVDATATASCTYGTSTFSLSFNSYPVTILIYNPSDVLVYSTIATGPVSVDDMPDLPSGQQYKIVAEDACGMSETVFLSPVISWLKHRGDVTQKCPGATWANGSGNINAYATTNTGALTVRIIKKNGVDITPLTPNLVKDSLYNFQDLGPATYVVSYKTTDACKKTFYDTITVYPYAYPNLNRSSAYQCDVNGFSVGAVVTNGIGPFTYEIIGSTPEVPSILAGPQSSPIFTIDNGSNYSLIRLRALDACGNATLGDASILPLANNGIRVSENCLGMESVLSVDTVYNGTVKWYYRKDKDDADSIYLGEFFKMVLDPLTIQDTGYYYAKVELNNGCITRQYQFHLNGDCYPILPLVQVELTGRYDDDKSILNWSVRNDLGLKMIVVERRDGEGYVSIGSVPSGGFTSPGQYKFVDASPGHDNFYRLKLQFENGKVVYSKVIHLTGKAKGSVRVYPNPAVEVVHLEMDFRTANLWQIELINAVSQKTILKTSFNGKKYSFNRTVAMPAGLYLIKLTDLESGQVYYDKVVFANKR